MAQMIGKRSCTRSFPCAVCGREDWCFMGEYSDGNLWFCASRKEDTVIGTDGNTYVLKGITKSNYARYEEQTQAERNKRKWVEEQARTNPSWKQSNYSFKKSPSPSHAVEEPMEIEKIVADEIAPLSNKRLNEIYSFMLDQLILEDFHKEALFKEWNDGIGADIGLGNLILSNWPIRSLPMPDYARTKGGYHELKNITRKELIDRMVKKFGSLRGVPGFYLKTSKWTDRNTGEVYQSTNWSLVNLSGIVYPVYDSNGYIFRIRIGDEHPDVKEYAKDSCGNYLYKEPIGDDDKKHHVTSAVYRFDNYTGEWFRIPYDKNGKRNDNLKELVYSRTQGIYKVKINAKGYPVVDGKPDGKYKNFSSRFEENHEEIIEKNGKKVRRITSFNRYAEGTRSGSHISLYAKPGDDFRFLYVTEGEKKAMVINAIFHVPVIALPGVQNYPLLFEKEYMSEFSMFDKLCQKGLTVIFIVYDADKATNDMVLNCEQKAIQMCLEHKVSTFVGEWDVDFGYKGADDALIHGIDFNYDQRT